MPVMSDVVAQALAAACGDPEVLARLGGPVGAATRAARVRAAERAVRTGWATVARAAVPAGLRGAHGSWIEAALAELPELGGRARAAVAAGGGDAIDVWLARWATAAIPPMPAVTAARVGSIDDAVRVDAAVLESWLEDVGADQLALSLAAAGPGAVAAAARRTGASVGQRLMLAAERIKQLPRAGALGSVRAAIARCRVVLDEQALVRIGTRAIAPHVDGLARLRMMYRLRRPLGLIVGEELAGWAKAAVADAPRWEALAAT